jgi:hypothetical protein
MKKHIFALVWVNDNSVFADLFYRVNLNYLPGVALTLPVFYFRLDGGFYRVGFYFLCA